MRMVNSMVYCNESKDIMGSIWMRKLTVVMAVADIHDRVILK